MFKRRIPALVTFALLTSLAGGPAGASSDILQQSNVLRMSGCSGGPSLEAPLQRDAMLDAAARRIAAGAELQAAANAEGYRARRVARIHVENPGGGDLGALLARQFCHLIGDPELVDAGVYTQGAESWMVLAAPLALPEGTSTVNAADRLFARANDARARQRRCGGQSFEPAGALRRSGRLDDAALLHAQDIAARGEMGHDGSDGSTAAERVDRAGYDWRVVGENVAAGQSTAEEVVDTWLASAGHCKNLMDPRFSETGVAVATNSNDDQVIFWVQVYASPAQ